MVRKIGFRDLGSIYCNIFSAFSKFGEAKSWQEKQAESGRNDRRQDLRWMLPILWFCLVATSFGFGCQISNSWMPPARSTYTNDSLLQPTLISMAVANDHSPDHGADPNGRDPHREQHDPGLPSNQAQNKYYGEKDPYGKPK